MLNGRLTISWRLFSEQDTELVDDEQDDSDEDNVDFERSGQAGRQRGSHTRKQQQSSKGNQIHLV